jgi:hypothetical protein
MEQNKKIEIDLKKEDLSILRSSVDRFKSTYRVSFDASVDGAESFAITVSELDPDLVFNLGYYYGALQHIDKRKKSS